MPPLHVTQLWHGISHCRVVCAPRIVSTGRIAADERGNPTFHVAAERPSFQPLDPINDPYFYPAWRRMLQTLKLVPALIGIFVVGWAWFGFVFWLELYLIFEWGECAAANSAFPPAWWTDQQAAAGAEVADASPVLAEVRGLVADQASHVVQHWDMESSFDNMAAAAAPGSYPSASQFLSVLVAALAIALAIWTVGGGN